MWNYSVFNFKQTSSLYILRQLILFFLPKTSRWRGNGNYSTMRLKIQLETKRFSSLLSLGRQLTRKINENGDIGGVRWPRRTRRRAGAVSYKDLRHGWRFINGRDRVLERQQKQFCCLEPTWIRSSSASNLFQA